MKKWIRCVLTVSFTAAVFLFTMTADSGAVTLAQNGGTGYSIVLAVDASPSEVHGAKELQSFFEMITDAYLPIYRENEDVPGPMILVGNSSKLQAVDSSIDFENLGPDGFVIKTAGRHLILAGSKVRGSMYAVYAFLEEKLGCRWYTSNVSRIPRLSKVTLPETDEVHKPAFESRNPFWYDAFDGDWSARNRVQRFQFPARCRAGRQR